MQRRKFITTSLLAALSPKIYARENRDKIRTLVDEFMKLYQVPGLSVSFSHKGQFIYNDAFGYADTDTKQKLTTTNTFRIASVSKPITSVGIFKLIEKGKLNLDDSIFGKGGFLDYDGPEEITVDHLLTHTCGGWSNKANELPMFRRINLNHDELIRWVLKNQKLKHKPGKVYEYSNFGYCLLGRVIEKISGESYERFIFNEVLKPCGVKNMTIGKNELADNEVQYFDHKGDSVTYKMNIPRMDSHGGWLGTPTEMVKFGMHVDNFNEPKDILTQASIKKMTAIDGVNKGYARGWNINKYNNYWHMGSLPGLSSLLVRTQSGFCWSACANTQRNGIHLAMDRLMWNISKHLQVTKN